MQSPGPYSELFKVPGDILFIVPPFAGIDRPSLGVHILQAIARSEGLISRTYYANINLAKHMGEADYVAVAFSPPLELLGERLFSRFAFPDEEFLPLSYFADQLSPTRSSQEIQRVPELSTKVHRLESDIESWLTEFGSLIENTTYKVFALSSMFAQNNACVAISNILKKSHPHSKIIIGGANCDGELASGIQALSKSFDYVFSGESESSFRAFCKKVLTKEFPTSPIVQGAPERDLDSVPMPDFSDYFEQLDYFLPQSELKKTNQIRLPYETSRGCWWGQKNHCTFCGLNANGMNFRQKSAEKALLEMRYLADKHRTPRYAMTDNIMPLSYFRDFLPKAAASDFSLDIFYEQKSNLKYHQINLLKRAGVLSIQPGIEALSSSLLKRMRKGVSAYQNLRLLKWCRSEGITVVWNLLYGFPGEGKNEYVETTRLIPLISHLSPPNGLSQVSFDRFSPYFDHPNEYEIQNLRPHPNYWKVYPRKLPINNLAYHFIGDFESDASPDIINQLRKNVRAWIDSWNRNAKPQLLVLKFNDLSYGILDSRNQLDTRVDLVDPLTAYFACCDPKESNERADYCIEKGWAVHIDQVYIGLATAMAEVIDELTMKFETPAVDEKRLQDIALVSSA